MARIFDIVPGAFNSPLLGCCCAVGVFDGLHLGHRKVIDSAIDAARREGCSSVVVTFHIDPDEMFAAASLKKLSSNEARVKRLSGLPVDYVGVLKFDEQLASMQPDRFLDEVFGSNVPRCMYVGTDFRFGRNASGGVLELEGWGKPRGMSVHPVGLLELGGEAVKSTRIRNLLAKGKVQEARDLLGHMYEVSGRVRSGRGEGADMGFATANIQIPESMKVVADGVYGGYAIVDGKPFKAAISVGIPPTFEQASSDNLEVHILDFDGSLYGSFITVQFAEWLRPMEKFEDVDLLVRQVQKDIAHIRAAL